MRLRSKVLGSTLAIAVVPLLLHGIYTYRSQRAEYVELTLNHLSSVAAIQQSRLTAILAQNRERLALVTSRTQLRLSLRRYLQEQDPRDAETMNRILTDAALSLPDLMAITVYSPDGLAVASTDRQQLGRGPAEPELLALAAAGPVVDRLHRDAAGQLRIYLAGPMQLEGQPLGWMVIRAQADNLLASLFDYAGLGESGETLLARPAPGGGFVFLAPTRFDPEAALRPVAEPGGGSDCVMFNDETRADCRDYRGMPVLVAGRAVPDTDWVLAVKIDKSETLGGVRRRAMAAGGLLLVLGLGAGAAAVRFGRSLSTPLLELGDAASAIAGGDYGQRVPVRTRDELGALGENFNAMAGQIADSRRELEARVEELNAALAEIKTLRGIIPICAGCKKIRDDKGYWNQLEVYLLEHSDALFSHGLCPDCLKIYGADADIGGPAV